VKRKVTITIEKDCLETEIFSDIVASAFFQHADFLKGIGRYGIGDLKAQGEQPFSNGCMLTWKHEISDNR